jgi:hypothetical protein
MKLMWKLYWMNFFAMIDSEAMNNYILHEAIRRLRLILQWWRNSAQIYIINEISVIVWDYVHMKVIIEDVSQNWHLMF